MKEELVSFQVAKLAKEKGFKNGSISTYHDDGALNIHYSNGKRVNGDSNMTNGIEAPTQTLLQRWLREVHKIECYAYPYRDHADDNNDPIRYRGHRSGMKMFNTFEEALENDLQKGLKLI